VPPAGKGHFDRSAKARWQVHRGYLLTITKRLPHLAFALDDL